MAQVQLQLLQQLYKDDVKASELLNTVSSLFEQLKGGDSVVLERGVEATIELLLHTRLEVQDVRAELSKLKEKLEAEEAKNKEELEQLVTKNKAMKEQLEQLVTKNKAEEDKNKAIKDKWAAGQVLHIVNEKILVLLMKETKLSSVKFWKTFKISNFGDIERFDTLKAAWPKVSNFLGLESGTTPKQLWKDLKFGKEPLDKYIHTDFDKLSYKEMKARTDLIFTDDLKRCKDTFLFFLDLSVKIGGDLYNQPE